VAKAKQLKFLVSGSNQFSRVNVSHAVVAEALKNAKELLARGYVDVKICTPRGQILVPDDFEQLERYRKRPDPGACEADNESKAPEDGL
jgi:hypothetical protein